jgi:hypothetical protein
MKKEETEKESQDLNIYIINRIIKHQALTAPICNAGRIATCKFTAFSFAAKSFDLAFI